MGMLCWKSQLFLIDENTLVFIQTYTVTHNEMKSAKYQTFLHPKQRQVPYVHKILFSLVNVYEENEWIVSKKRNLCNTIFRKLTHFSFKIFSFHLLIFFANQMTHRGIYYNTHRYYFVVVPDYQYSKKYRNTFFPADQNLLTVTAWWSRI